MPAPFRHETAAATESLPRILYGAPFDLRAVRREGGIYISWNRNSDLVADAASGTLSITDGNESTALPMNREQLRFGQFFISPRSERVQVSLEVLSSSNRRVQEAVGISPITAKAPVAPVVAKNVPAAAAPVVVTPPARPLIPPAETVRARKETSATPPPFTPPPAREQQIAAVPSVLQTQAPALPAADHDLRAAAQLPVQQSRPAVGLPAPGSPVPEIVKPAPAPAEHAAPPAPSPTAQAAATIIPPVPILQPAVVIPSALKMALTRQAVEVAAKATIDENGRVKEIRPAGPMSPLESNLFVVARMAVVNWRFRPARIGAKPVESEYTIRFRFGGNQR